MGSLSRDNVQHKPPVRGADPGEAGKNAGGLEGDEDRGTGRIADITKALGALPMPLEMVDVYEALRRGVLDGNWATSNR